MWYIYIIYSKSHDVYYKGENDKPFERLKAHNENKSRYTSFKGPWELSYLEEFPDRKEALIREKMLKRQNRKYIEWLIQQPVNLIKTS